MKDTILVWFTSSSSSSFNPVFPRVRRWPDATHSFSNRSHSLSHLARSLATAAFKRLFKVVQARKRVQIEKSAGITVAGNLVTDMGSASRFELALFMRSYQPDRFSKMHGVTMALKCLC